uniref:Mediator of RNA polymerase II transcription subunit 19 n=1 Tax=Globodera pallida TaxID=36090 RepID=A0A183BMQ6_GLOPA
MEQQQQAIAAASGISSGFLRTKISLKGSQSQLSLVSPFYGMKPELPSQSQLLGSDDLISLFDLSGAYNRYCGAKKPREDLASFLPHVCAATHINKKADSQCSLRKLIEDPPIMGREINNLTASQMVGFKLTPGPIPDANRFFDLPEQPTNSGGATTAFLPHSASAPQFEPSTVVDDRRQRKRIKRSLDELTLEDADRKAKRAKGGEESGGREKERKKKKEKKRKKKDKEKRVEEETVKRIGGEPIKRETPEQPTNSGGATAAFLPHSASAPQFEPSTVVDDRRQRKRIKRSLDELTLEDADRKAKRARGGEESGGREKERKKKKEKKRKKKDKEKRVEEETVKRIGGEPIKRETVMPFF